MSSAAAGYLEERSQRAKHPRIGPFGDVLGDLAGKRVVEYGCGDGELTVRLAESGALVSAFDGSRACVERTRRLAEANGVRVEAVGASAERLPYADETFDLAVGQAVLQRLDPERARYELWRILKPGGKGFFSEPRRHVDLALWSRDFSESGCRHAGLLRRRALVWMVK